MKLFNIGHSFNYELEKLCRIFLPFEKIEIENIVVEADRYAISELVDNNGSFIASAKL